ncbi:hypothetical protein OIO90_003383 [Microbotryomycetes sp. JL221]|nr:hypothetical protein OIO90_003383 [Microbotryomycetes sp. JL221]
MYAPTTNIKRTSSPVPFDEDEQQQHHQPTPMIDSRRGHSGDSIESDQDESVRLRRARELDTTESSPWTGVAKEDVSSTSEHAAHGSRFDYPLNANSTQGHPSAPSQHDNGNMKDKLIGKAQILSGKLTSNEDRVVRGELRKRGEQW